MMTAQPETSQLLLPFEVTVFTDKKQLKRKFRDNWRKVETIMTDLHRIHDDLNAALYNCKTTDRPAIHSPTDIYNLLSPFLDVLDHEELWTILLDTRNRVMKLVKLYQGSVSNAQVRIGEVFHDPIIEGAPAIVIAHNHPSGDATPSPEDIAITRSIVQAGKLLDIDVLDHIIVGRGQYTSLRERGLGFG